MTDGKVTIKDIVNYFGMKTGEFMTHWKKLSQKDKDEIKRGIADGTLTY